MLLALLAAGHAVAQGAPPVCGSESIWEYTPGPQSVGDNGCGFPSVGSIGEHCDPDVGCPYVHCWSNGGGIEGICAGSGHGPRTYSGSAHCVTVVGDDDAACDDGNPCNGTETCDGIGCLVGAPLDCDDELVCTVDTCEADVDGGAPCRHTFDEALCTCSTVVHQEYEISSTTPGINLAAGTCPIVGGENTFDVNATFSGKVAFPNCANRCKAAVTDTLKAELIAKACGAGGSVAIDGNVTAEVQGCPSCSATDCEQTCSFPGEGCEADAFGGGGGVTLFRKIGIKRDPNVQPRNNKLIDTKLVSVRGRFSGKIGLKVGAKFTHKDTDGELSCGTCQQCSETTADFSVGTFASLDAFFRIRAGKRRFNVVGDDLAKVDVDMTGHLSSKAGECAAPGQLGCSAARADAKLSFKTPPVSLPAILWFKPLREFSCSGGVEACNETNSCGTCSCGGAACSDFNANKFTCGLTANN